MDRRLVSQSYFIFPQIFTRRSHYGSTALQANKKEITLWTNAILDRNLPVAIFPSPLPMTPRASIHPRIQSSYPTKHVNSDWIRVCSRLPWLVTLLCSFVGQETLLHNVSLHPGICGYQQHTAGVNPVID